MSVVEEKSTSNREKSHVIMASTALTSAEKMLHEFAITKTLYDQAMERITAAPHRLALELFTGEVGRGDTAALWLLAHVPFGMLVEHYRAYKSQMSLANGGLIDCCRATSVNGRTEELLFLMPLLRRNRWHALPSTSLAEDDSFHRCTVVTSPRSEPRLEHGQRRSALRPMTLAKAVVYVGIHERAGRTEAASLMRSAIAKAQEQYVNDPTGALVDLELLYEYSGPTQAREIKYTFRAISTTMARAITAMCDNE